MSQDQTFRPSDINQYILYNENYNVIPVKIRLEQVSDPATIKFGPGQQIVFSIKYNGSLAKFYYNNAEVQMIDLNDGGKSDDLATPNADNNKYNTLRFYQGNPQGGEDVINFDVGTYLRAFGDSDGIAGGVAANFRQTVVGSAIKASISK